MSVRPTRRRCAIGASAVAGVMLAGLAAGCSHQSAGPRRASVESCIQFGISAIKHHVTVTSVPAACQGLTRAQVNFAVGSALHVMAIGPGGKVGQRKRVAKFSPFLAHLAASVPEQRSQPPVSAPAAQPAQPVSRTTLGLVALVTWLITAGLGSTMTVRWIARGGLRRARAGRAKVRPTMIVAHFGLAVTGLLAWIAYLVTGLTSVAWIASGLLLPVIGLGLAMLLLSLPERSLRATAIPAAQAAPADAASGPAMDDPPRARHPPTLIVVAHGVFAMATILFAILAAVGLGSTR
jgi:hypothetical protein